MDPLTLILLISAVASAGTSIGSAFAQKGAQEEANKTNIELQKLANESQMQQVREVNEFNAAEAQKQRDFEAEMSNTAVQRAMSDYAAAGLNPILAVPGGATVSSGASAQGNVANIGAARVSPAALDLSGVASAIQSMTNYALTMKLLGVKESSVAVSAQNAETNLMKALHQGKFYDSASEAASARAKFLRSITRH